MTGDQILLASTTLNSSESEILNILALSNNEITLVSSAKYYHYGHESPLKTDVGELDNRGEVIMTSGSVVIQNDKNTPENCQIYIAQDVINSE